MSPSALSRLGSQARSGGLANSYSPAPPAATCSSSSIPHTTAFTVAAMASRALAGASSSVRPNVQTSGRPLTSTS